MATVLVASTDPVIASLLGTLLEVERHRAIFPTADEAVLAAMERERPDLLLLDCDHPDCRGEDLITRTQARGTGIVLFSPGRVDDEVRAQAEASGLSWFSLPIDRVSLGNVLAAALGQRTGPKATDGG